MAAEGAYKNDGEEAFAISSNLCVGCWEGSAATMYQAIWCGALPSCSIQIVLGSLKILKSILGNLKTHSRFLV